MRKIVNLTYNNFMLVMKKIMEKGYGKDEAEKITRHIFEQREAFPEGLSVEALINMVQDA